jgi:autotransporter-like protein
MAGILRPERTVTAKQPSLKNGKAAGAFVALAVLASVLPVTAAAKTFTEASSAAFEQICGNIDLANPNSALRTLCGSNINPGGSVSVAPATGASQGEAGATVEQRAQAFRESQESSQPASPARVRPAFYPGDQISASDGQAQLPPPGGVSPEILLSPAQGLSLFASAGAFALNHHNNRFEDGYQATLPTVTIGADYQVTPRLLAGVAFNYTNSNATYDDGGGFDKNIFAPVLYATYLPFDGAFVNASLGYARSENSNNRKAVVPSA